MQRAPDHELITFDTETHLFSQGRMAPRVVCVSTATSKRAPMLQDAASGAEWLRGAFEFTGDGHARIIAHNAAYDAACLLEWQPQIAASLWRAYDSLGVHCTRVRERLIDIARGTRFERDDEGNLYRKDHSLASIAKRRLGVTLDKDTWRMNYADLDGIPIESWPAGARDYATDDAKHTLAVWQSQEDQVRREFPHYAGWSDEAARQSCYALALHLMTCRGLMVDQPKVRALKGSLEAQLGDLRGKLVAGGVVNAKTGSRVMAAIRARVEASWAGEGEIPRTGKGAVSTASDVIEQCTDEVLGSVVDYAHIEKLLGAFVAKLEEAGELPIHATFDVLGADSGRTSCRNPNLQQQPRAPGVRECFRAREGFALATCDYDSQETRAFAQVLKTIVGRSRLAERYAADPDYDPHSHFAAALLKIDYLEALARKAAKDKEFKTWRQRAKAAIFGFPGGMGAKTFRVYARGYGLNLTQTEAEELRDRYFEFEPFARDYFAFVQSNTERGNGQVQHLFSGRLRGDCTFPAYANSLFQGLGADITKLALWEVTKRSYGAPGTEGSALFGCRPVVFVHDELIVEVPIDYAHEAAVELQRVMVDAMQELTPDVPARASPSLMLNWSKEAEGVWDASGRLIPWEWRPQKAAA